MKNIGRCKNRWLVLAVFIVFSTGSLFAEGVRCRIVDYGADVGNGTYYGRSSKNYPEIKGGLGGTASGWPYDPTKPMNPPGLEYDVEAASAIFYGGVIGFHTKGAMSEGLINPNHGMYDDFNMMSCQQSLTKEDGFKVRCYGLWYWQKENFLNGGDKCKVSFDDKSMIVPYICRYWDDVDGGRWVVRDGDKFYVSEAQFGTAADKWRKPPETSAVLHPTKTKWALYTPQSGGDFHFDAGSAKFEAHEFKDVTAVGFYVARDTWGPGVVAVKWHAFEAIANVSRPKDQGVYSDLVKVPETAGVPAFQMMKTEVSYATWLRVRKWAGQSQHCENMGADTMPGYILDREGDMGSMKLGNLKHSGLEPATQMSWLDAVAWCNALSELEGLTPCYYEDEGRTKPLRKIKERDVASQYGFQPKIFVKWEADGYRLPTAAEWSAAAAFPNPTGSPFAWGKENSNGTTHEVGKLASNAAGIHDLRGNVWEWVWDVGGDSFDPEKHKEHTVFGGSFCVDGAPSKTLLPYGEKPWQGSFQIGFRAVRGSGKQPPFAATAGAAPKWSFATDTALAPETSGKPEAFTAADFVKLQNGKYSYHDADVTLSDYEMSKTEITYAKWNSVYQWATNNGYYFDYDGSMGSMNYRVGAMEHVPEEPVTTVGWYDAVVWCNALSEMEGKKPVYYLDAGFTQPYKVAHRWRISMFEGEPQRKERKLVEEVFADWNADGYRLPTMAEWTYAYGGGKSNVDEKNGIMTKDAEEKCLQVGWFEQNSGSKTQPVGKKPANAFGLYDMDGNVAEWTWDLPGFEPDKTHNPKGLEFSKRYGNEPRRLMGGSFGTPPKGVGNHKCTIPDQEWSARSHYGFRVVRCEAGTQNQAAPEAPKLLEIDSSKYDALEGKIYRGNLARTGLFKASGAPGLKSAKWTFKAGGPVRSSPVLVDGIVYIGSDDNHFYALDAKDGKVVWKKNLGGKVVSSAAVTDGKVFIGSSGKQFYALDAKTGEEKWKYATPGAVTISPAVAYGVVFFGNGPLNGEGKYVGLDIQTGAEKWVCKLKKCNNGPGGPAIVGTALYAPVADNVKLAAEISTGLFAEGWAPKEPGNHAHNCMAVGDDFIAYDAGAHCYILDKTTGNVVGRYQMSKEKLAFFPTASPIIHAGKSYFAKQGKGDGSCGVYAFKNSAVDFRGGPFWKFKTSDDINSSPALASGVIYVGCNDGHLYALDAETGAEKAKFKTGGAVWSSPWPADGVVFVGSDDGCVYAIE